MLRATQIILLGSAVLAAPGSGPLYAQTAPAQNAPACVDASSPTGAAMETAKVATAQQPAQILAKDGPNSLSSSPALQLTLRPTAADPNTPFLVQIFAKDTCAANATEPGELLGVVSFFPVKMGQSQDFVLAAPEKGFPSVAPQNVQLTVKLIPANPARSLAKASVEVVKAQFAK
jgi:hypothetical protein